MAYKISQTQAAEIATLLILMAEIGKDAVSTDQLKFQYARAGWCDNVAAGVLDLRDREIDRFIENAISPRRFGRSALKLKLIDWDPDEDRFSRGARAGDFLQKLNASLFEAGIAQSSSSESANIKRWLRRVEALKGR